MPTEEYPEHAMERACLDQIAQFAMVQQFASAAIAGYLETQGVSSAVKKLIWRGERMSDQDKCDAFVVLAKVTGYPLHEEAFRAAYEEARTTRDMLTTGGPPIFRRYERTDLPMMWGWQRSLITPGHLSPVVLDLTKMNALVQDSRWMHSVVRRLWSLARDSGETPEFKVPSDLPVSAIDGREADITGRGTPPLCPLGHENVAAVNTRYGDAWLCHECDHVRLLDDTGLVSSRPV